MIKQPPCILLVEDNAMNRDMLSRRLARWGYDVAVAEDGEQALEMTVRRRPTLILMDVSLPGMSGLDVTRRFKRDPELSQIPIIVLTAHARMEDEVEAREAGADDFETKPVESSRLLDKLERWTGVSSE